MQSGNPVQLHRLCLRGAPPGGNRWAL